MNITLSKNSRGLGVSKRTDVFSCYSAVARETIVRPLIRVIVPSLQYLIRFLTVTYVRVERVLIIE